MAKEKVKEEPDSQFIGAPEELEFVGMEQEIEIIEVDE